MPWFSLEAISGLVALETVWQQMVGDRFSAFNTLCLQRATWQVLSIPCARGCGCNHSVIRRHDGAGAVGICRCQPSACPDIALSQIDITPLEVSRPRLGYALCKAFGLASRQADLPTPGTFQFGSWSTAAVPAILTIQVQNSVFRRAVAEVAAQLRQPFMLFAPTSDFLDAPAKSILENYGAAFFGLDTHVILTANGTLQPTRPPGELFARFTPQPKDQEVDVARRAFALVRNLDTEQPLRPPTLLTVFRHYCIEEKSASAIARKYDCSKPTILRRLALIRAKTGVDPKQLRRLSPHIAKLEDSLNDPRAARPNRRAHLEEGDEDSSS
jgi:hypothetical protein